MALKRDRETMVIDPETMRATLSGSAVGPEGGGGAGGATGANATGGGSASPLPAPTAAPTGQSLPEEPAEPSARSVAELTSLLAKARIIAADAKSEVQKLTVELDSARVRASGEVEAQVIALELRVGELCRRAESCESGLQRQSVAVKDWAKTSLPEEGVRQFGRACAGVQSTFDLLLDDLRGVVIEAGSQEIKLRHAVIVTQAQTAYFRIIAIEEWLKRAR